MKNLVDQVLEGLPTEPALEEEGEVEGAIAGRAEGLAETLSNTEVASVLLTIVSDVYNREDRGFGEGDIATGIAQFEIERAVLWQVAKRLAENS